jgi:hypothetical protein
MAEFKVAWERLMFVRSWPTATTLLHRRECRDVRKADTLRDHPGDMVRVACLILVSNPSLI